VHCVAICDQNDGLSSTGDCCVEVVPRAHIGSASPFGGHDIDNVIKFGALRLVCGDGIAEFELLAWIIGVDTM
jgi:hypothetical protein